MVTQKEILFGNWEAIKLNNESIQSHGFTSIEMKVSPDSIEVITKSKSFGEVTTKSRGSWVFEKGTIKSKFENSENYQLARVQLQDGNLIFSPDPFFNPETVFKSEYKRVK